MSENLELSKTDQQSLATFEKMKATIDEQVKSLSLIKVTDEASLAVANHQLSKGKDLGKQVDNAHEKVKAPAWAVCKAADKLKRDLKAPLDDAMGLTEKEVLAWGALKEKERQEKDALIAKQKADAEKKAQEAKEKTEKDIAEFEAAAFNAIEVSDSEIELAEAYAKYVTGFPLEYPEIIKSRIKSLGTAKVNVLRMRNIPDLKGETSKEITGIYHEMYMRFNNIKPEIKVVVAAPISAPSFEVYMPGTSNIKKTWTFEVIDITKVPAHFLTIDESQVKKFIKECESSLRTGDHATTPGIKYFQVSSVKIK